MAVGKILKMLFFVQFQISINLVLSDIGCWLMAHFEAL